MWLVTWLTQVISAFRTSVVLMSNFSFTNGVKTSYISKVNRNTSFSHRTLIQRNACLFLHIGSPHWWPHNSQGSSHLLQELSPAREGCHSAPISSCSQVPIRCLGSLLLASTLPHPSVMCTWTGKPELCSINTKEHADRSEIEGPAAPPQLRPSLSGRVTLMRCQRQLTEHSLPVPKTDHLKREQNHFLQEALYCGGVCVWGGVCVRARICMSACVRVSGQTFTWLVEARGVTQLGVSLG